MQLCVPLRALTFLLVTLFHQSTYSSDRPHDCIKLPLAEGEPVCLSLHILLKNRGMSLGKYLADFSADEIFTIQAMKNDSQTEYFYGTSFFETDPSFLASYTIKRTLHNEQLVPIVIKSSFKKTSPSGLNPEAAAFCPSTPVQVHHRAPMAHHPGMFQPLPAPIEMPTPASPQIPPLISLTLSSRKSALIEAMQQQKSAWRIDSQWQKTLTILCEVLNYPFTNLNLSFPTAEEIFNTPKQIPYTTEGAIKKMEEEASLESTSEEKRKSLEKDIEILKQFMEDIKKPHPLAYDGIKRASQLVIAPTPPPSAPATVLTVSPLTVEASAQEDQVPDQNTATSHKAIIVESPSLTEKKATPTIPQATPLAKKSTPLRNITIPTPELAKSVVIKAPKKALVPTSAIIKSAATSTPTAVKATPIPSGVSRQPATSTATPIATKKPTREDFFAECAIAATVSTLPAAKEPSGPSKFEKQQLAAEKHRLAKLAKEEAKEAATAAKIRQEQEKATLEKERYVIIKTACDQEDYASAISTLALCDETTEWFANNIFFLTTQLPKKKYRGDFSQLTELVTKLLQQKTTGLSDEKKSHLLLYLSTFCDLKMRLTYLKQAADLKNIVAEAQWLALKIKEQLDDPDFKPCTIGEHCLHDRVTRFFKLHSENELLKPLLATYLLSLFSIQSRCPNIELRAPLDQLYTMAQRHLSPEDYAFLLTLRPQSTSKMARLVHQEALPYTTTSGYLDLDALVGAALQQNLPLPVSSDPTFIVFFEKFHKDVKAIYKKPNSNAETRAMLKDFFKERIIHSAQIHFVFETLMQESELAVFYEVLNELMRTKQLPLLPEEEFKTLSHSVATYIAAQLHALESDTRPIMEIARTYLRKIQTAASTNTFTPHQRPVTFSHTPFTNSLLEIFNGFNTLRNEFEEKIRTATATRKKSTETLLARRKGAIYSALTALLEIVKTKEDVTHFLTALSQFEVNESYPEVRDIIDTHLQTGGESIQQTWRPYVILPNPCKFSSLKSWTIPGSFPLRCAAFHKQLTTYLTHAPLEKEVFKAVEAIIIQFLATTKTHEDIELFLKTFAREESFCFCIGGLFTHLKHSRNPELSTAFNLVFQFERYLIERIKDTTEAPVPAPLLTYLKETLSALQLFIKEKSSTLLKAAASFEGTVTLPAETEYSDPQKNKFLGIITEIVSHAEEKTKIVDALFAHILKLSPPELPYFMYALGTNTKPLLLDIRQKVELSEELHLLIKQMLLMGFETLCN